MPRIQSFPASRTAGESSHDSRIDYPFSEHGCG
jgi:hypothetical protein